MLELSVSTVPAVFPSNVTAPVWPGTASMVTLDETVNVPTYVPDESSTVSPETAVANARLREHGAPWVHVVPTPLGAHRSTDWAIE